MPDMHGSVGRHAASGLPLSIAYSSCIPLPTTCFQHGLPCSPEATHRQILHKKNSAPCLSVNRHSTSSHHCPNTSCVQVLDELPADLPLAEVSPLLCSMLLYNTEQSRNSDVVLHLRRAENLMAREELVKVKQRVVALTFDRACCICHKRMGGAVSVAYPNGSLAHYLCYKRATQQQQQQQKGGSSEQQQQQGNGTPWGSVGLLQEQQQQGGDWGGGVLTAVVQ